MGPKKAQQPNPAAVSGDASLESWKQIANYLKRGERTVRRWEKEGLPVHRHMHKSRASVYAYKSEIDVWWKKDRSRLEAAEAAAKQNRRVAGWIVAVGLALPLVLLGLNIAGLRDRFFSGSASTENPSIAVLPLKNLSADRDQDYFADGMTEALITQLSKISTLDVISHQSMLRYRDATKSLPHIARELNVKAVLEGTVLRAGDKVRITANLVQASPERHLWAESFEVDQRDILAVQSRVAREVASHIHAKLTSDERMRLTTQRAADPEAYAAYLLGRAHFYKPPSRANAVRAREYFEQAIAKDPGYAPTYASLAELYIWTGGAGTLTRETSGNREAHMRARMWAEKALSLDETLADAHNALAIVKQAEWDWAGAEREYRRAIELNHSHAVAHVSYAMHLYALRRFEEAAALAKRAQQLDPVAPFVNTWAGAAYVFAGREREAMEALKKALELEPGHHEASLVLARTYVAKRMYPQAIAELDKALVFNPTDPAILGALAHAYGRAGDREKGLQVVEQMKRNGAAPRGSMPNFSFVWAYAGLGDKEQAFAWLERAYEVRQQRIVWLSVDPLLDPIRNDPRFTDFLQRVGLPSRIQPSLDGDTNKPARAGASGL